MLFNVNVKEMYNICELLVRMFYVHFLLRIFLIMFLMLAIEYSH